MKAVILTFILFSNLANSEMLERDYQNKWCKGEVEFVLKDRTRVDCLTNTHAIEIEFAHKWKEAIGQSLHYSLITGKKAGILLILRKSSDKKYLEQINTLIKTNKLHITLWTLHH